MGVDSLKKIERLERQARRYEEEISHLESIIDKLQIKHSEDISEREILLSRISELTCMLRKSEKLCEAKESFIQYRESQLLEFEDEIYNLKQRIAVLTSQKEIIMADTHTDNPLNNLSNDRLVEEMNNVINKMFSMLDQALKTSENKIRIEYLQQRGLAVIQKLYARYKNNIFQCHQSKDKIERECKESRDLILQENEKLVKDYDILKNKYDDFFEGSDPQELRRTLQEQAKQADINNNLVKQLRKDLSDSQIKCEQEKNELQNHIKTWRERAFHQGNNYDTCKKEKQKMEREFNLKLKNINDKAKDLKNQAIDLGNQYINCERKRIKLKD